MPRLALQAAEVLSSHFAGRVFFVPLAGVDQHPAGAGLTYIDHLTHNVHRGRMDEWASFYERLFNFREVRYFDIEGKLTGLKSKAMTSPCGKIRIPINESSDDKSQIAEYLDVYHGEGIQHIALGTDDIYRTVGGYVSGNLLISLVAGSLTAIVLAIMGVPYAIALGLIVAILDLIPLAGLTENTAGEPAISTMLVRSRRGSRRMRC